MTIMKNLIIAAIFFALAVQVDAQATPGKAPADTSQFPYWIKMMKDPAANFNATVSAFNKYWKQRPITKGCGWKVFKRWEYIMGGRVAKDGTKPAQDAACTSWKKFSQNNRSVYGNWQSLGPSSIPYPGPAGYEGLGRLNVIAFHPTSQNKIYAGAPSGGFWLSHDNGATWNTTTDNLPTIGVSAIVVDFANPANILMGTGDRDHGDAPGLGVYKSTNGGLAWSVSNSGMGNVTVGKLIQHPGNAQVFIAATTGGVFRSADGGANWMMTHSGDFNDICIKPNDPDIVYAVSGGNFYRSADNGLTFVQITSGLSEGQRGAVAVSAGNLNYVYFLQSDYGSGFQGLYRSADAGLNFTTRSTSPNILDWSCDGSGTGGQGWYDLSLAADPANAEIIYVGGVDVWKSTSGGTTWTINSHWYGGCGVPAVHADCHFLGFSPANGRLYAGNDGGIYYTANGGTAWTDCTVGMTIGQIYKLGQSQTDPGKTINGFQDNGTYTNLSTGWVATGGGDGMECAVDYLDGAYSYYTIYFGDIFRTYNNGSTYQVAGNGAYGIDESGAWVTPFILGESDPKVMFAGYLNVWRCNNVRLSPPVWTKISSGETNYCEVLEQSPANTNILYVVRGGSLKRTENANDASPTWVSCALPGGNSPSDLEAHPTDQNIVYATAYKHVYKSTDKGTTWNLLPGLLPDIPINTIVYDKNTTEGLYIGTQAGVLYKNPTMADWVVFSTGLPVVDIRELEIYYNGNPANNKLMAATFGRGLWRSDLFSVNVAPSANFSSNPSGPCLNETVQLKDLSLNFPNSWSWSFSPPTVTFVNATNSNSQNPEVLFNQNTTYTVTLIATNAIGSSTVSIPVEIGGIHTPFSDSFESGTFSGNWQISNPDNNITWTIVNAGGNGTSARSAFINFYDYNSSGSLDDLISCAIKLNGTLHPWLKFRVAYRRYNSEYSDRLKVFISTDCGTTWVADPVYDRAGTSLATGPDQLNYFVPAATSDWRLDSVDLTAYRLNSLKLKFQAVNGYGNNLYLDDISLAEWPVLLVPGTTITDGQSFCFNATQTITVPAGGSNFVVLNGGSATMIAGQNIFYKTGTLVNSGGYMSGSIEPGGPYCSAPSLPLEVSGETDPGLSSMTTSIVVYPNPTTGSFTLELNGSDPSAYARVDIFNANGEQFLSETVAGNLKCTFSLAEKPTGLYFIRVNTKERSWSGKLVKL